MTRPKTLRGCRNAEQRQKVYDAACRDAQFATSKDTLELLDGSVFECGVVVAIYAYTGFRIRPDYNARQKQIRCYTEYPHASDEVPHGQSMIVSEELTPV